MSSIADGDRKAWLRAFGRAVREIRTREGITQERLGYQAGLDQTYVSGIERGRRNPTLWVIWRLAEGLRTSPTELISFAENHLKER